MKMALLSKINLKANPNLIRLLESDETLETLLKLPPEKLLLRWFNYQLEQAGVFSYETAEEEEQEEGGGPAPSVRDEL